MQSTAQLPARTATVVIIRVSAAWRALSAKARVCTSEPPLRTVTHDHGPMHCAGLGLGILPPEGWTMTRLEEFIAAGGSIHQCEDGMFILSLVWPNYKFHERYCKTIEAGLRKFPRKPVKASLAAVLKGRAYRKANPYKIEWIKLTP